LGAISPAQRTLSFSPRIGLLIGVSALLVLLQVAIDYRHLSIIYSGKWDPQVDSVELIRLAENSIIAPYAYAIATVEMRPAQEQAEVQAQVCEKGLRVWPRGAMAGRCAKLHFMAGNVKQGEALSRTARAAFRTPTEINDFESQLNPAIHSQP